METETSTFDSSKEIRGNGALLFGEMERDIVAKSFKSPERTIMKANICIRNSTWACMEKVEKSMLIEIPKECDYEDSFFPCVSIMSKPVGFYFWGAHHYCAVENGPPPYLPAFLFLNKKEGDSIMLHFGEKFKLELIIDQTSRNEQTKLSCTGNLDPFETRFRPLFFGDQVLRNAFFFPEFGDLESPLASEQLKRLEDFRSVLRKCIKLQCEKEEGNKQL